MKRLEDKVAELSSSGRTGLSFFLTGGYPSMESFKELVKYIDKNSLADFLEIGIPFSDPLADGPVIQKTSLDAIREGATLPGIIRAVGEMKDEIDIPLVLMSYINPFYALGLERVFRDAAEAGFSALIIPDMPFGEDPAIEKAAMSHGLDTIYLAAPSCNENRIKKISSRSRPFLYYVSSYGVTGARKKLPRKLSSGLQGAVKVSDVPVYCGFGISTPQQAADIAEYADGIIIGSAFLKKIDGDKSSYFKEIRKFAISVRKEIDKGYT